MKTNVFLIVFVDAEPFAFMAQKRLLCIRRNFVFISPLSAQNPPVVLVQKTYF